MTKRDQLILSRDTLERAMQVACSVVDDAGQPDELRCAAHDVEFILSEALCYQPYAAPDEREIRLLPIGMKWPQHFTSMTEEFLLDIGAEVREGMPAYALMARMAAKYADDALLSVDFRLSSYDVLNTILAAMTRAAQDEREEDGVPAEEVAD